MSALPSVAVIGAGASGITATKALHEAGVPVTCFEASDRIGGTWVFGNRNGKSAAYRDLHINTSRDKMAFADFPMRPELPDFPHHTQIVAYFEDYVDHFGFRDRIVFGTEVIRVTRGEGGGYDVRTRPAEHAAGPGEERPETVHHFDAVLVANGHHWDPQWPEPAFEGSGTFEGEQLHAHSYVDSSLFAGKRVLLVGMGNSAMDLAVESSYVAQETFLSARRGAYIVPKYLFGRPIDHFPNDPRVPLRIRQAVFQLLLRLGVGDVTKYGLPKPDHRFGQAHPTVSSRILDRIQHGRVKPRPGIRRLEGRSVVFTDGTKEEIDLVVYCTGYKISFPFLDPGIVDVADNRIELFHRAFKPGLPDLAFVGLLQPLGSVMPMAEAQGRLLAAYFTGRYALPPAAEMQRVIAADQKAMRKRYVASKRHTIQVDAEEFLLGIERELQAGAARAAAAGNPLPVKPAPETETAAVAAGGAQA